MSPSANPRQQRRSSLKVPESTPTEDCPAANTRVRTSGNLDRSQSSHNSRRARSASPNNTPREVKSSRVRRGSPAKPGPSRVLIALDGTSSSDETTTNKGHGVAAAVKRSQSLRNRVITKASSTASLRSDASIDSSGKDRLDLDSTKHKTTEELELEKIAALKKEVEKTRKLAQVRSLVLLCGIGEWVLCHLCAVVNSFATKNASCDRHFKLPRT